MIFLQVTLKTQDRLRAAFRSWFSGLIQELLKSMQVSLLTWMGNRPGPFGLNPWVNPWHKPEDKYLQSNYASYKAAHHDTSQIFFTWTGNVQWTKKYNSHCYHIVETLRNLKVQSAALKNNLPMHTSCHIPLLLQGHVSPRIHKLCCCLGLLDKTKGHWVPAVFSPKSTDAFFNSGRLTRIASFCMKTDEVMV